MKNRRGRFCTEKILGFMLFAIVSVCVLLVVLAGADVYGRLTQRGQDAYERRTVPQYIATKVRQADSEAAVSVGRRNGVDTLQLTEWISGKNYVTHIYCYEGFVRELFAEESVSFEPESGEKIAEATRVEFTLEKGCLHVSVDREDGESEELILMLRSMHKEDRYEK